MKASRLVRTRRPKNATDILCFRLHYSWNVWLLEGKLTIAYQNHFVRWGTLNINNLRALPDISHLRPSDYTHGRKTISVSVYVRSFSNINIFFNQDDRDIDESEQHQQHRYTGRLICWLVHCILPFCGIGFHSSLNNRFMKSFSSTFRLNLWPPGLSPRRVIRRRIRAGQTPH